MTRKERHNAFLANITMYPSHGSARAHHVLSLQETVMRQYLHFTVPIIRPPGHTNSDCGKTALKHSVLCKL